MLVTDHVNNKDNNNNMKNNMKNTLESRVEKHLVSRTKAKGWMCIKFIPSYFAGFPDRIVLRPGGKISFVELKRPKGGTVSYLQQVVHNQLTKLGFEVLVIRNYNEVNETINRWNYDK